jgi:SAM-dependent methyltransferase
MSAVKAVFHALVRRKTQVKFGDLNALGPVSRAFGWERGTPIDRLYIDAFLDRHRGDIRGEILEVGELRYVQKFGQPDVGGSILVPTLNAAKCSGRAAQVIVADLSKPETLPEGKFDCFVCTQTFNFIYDVRGAIAGAYRLLKTKGVLLGTVAGYCAQVSRYDAARWGDYWRFSENTMARLLSEVFENAPEVTSYGNALAAQALIQGVAVEDLPNRTLLNPKDKDYPIIIGFKCQK